MPVFQFKCTIPAVFCEVWGALCSGDQNQPDFRRTSAIIGMKSMTPSPCPVTVDDWQWSTVILENCSHQSPTDWMELNWGSFCPSSMFYVQFYLWFAEWLWPPPVFLISLCRWRKALVWSTNVCKCYDRMIYKVFLSTSWGKEMWGEQRKESRKTSKSRRNITGLGKHFSPAAPHYFLCACFTTTIKETCLPQQQTIKSATLK